MAWCLFVFAVICALPSLSVLYLPLYVIDWSFVPVSIDRKPTWLAGWNLLSSPVMNNVVLLLMFAIPHSILPRSFVKEPVSAVLTSHGYTSLYVAMSGATLIATMLLWAPMTYPVWSLPWKWAELPITALFLLVLMMYRRAAKQVDSLELIGLRGPLNELQGKSPRPLKLVATGMYGRVRHPMMSLQMAMLWLTPHMTAGHALFAAVFTVYVVTAVTFFEEPALIRAFGDPYLEYMKTVPRFIPRLITVGRRKEHN